MKVLIRAGIMVAAAAGITFVLSTVAQADVVTPESALQPASARLVSDPASSGGTEDPSSGSPVEEAFMSGLAAQMAEAADGEVAVPATPAPEEVVTRAPSSISPSNSRTVEEVGGLDRVVQPFRTGFHQVGEYLGRVVSACQVGLGSGAGGPALVLAVLAMVVAFERRRVLRAQSATDEAVPEFLFARELTPPG